MRIVDFVSRHQVGADGGKRVKYLIIDPYPVAVLEVPGRDVVPDGVTSVEVAGFRPVDLTSLPADDDDELRLVVNLRGVVLVPGDLARRPRDGGGKLGE